MNGMNSGSKNNFFILKTKGKPKNDAASLTNAGEIQVSKDAMRAGEKLKAQCRD